MHEDRPDALLKKMASAVGARAGGVVCVGHTHLARHRITASVIHVVNAGSAGRPKDGDPRGGYVLLDLSDEGAHVETVRVAYDGERAARGILAREVPDEFADFLRTGGRSAVTTSD